MDRVPLLSSMVPVGPACLAAVMTCSKETVVGNCPSVLLVEVTFQPFMVKVLEEFFTPGWGRVVGVLVTSP